MARITPMVTANDAKTEKAGDDRPRAAIRTARAERNVIPAQAGKRKKAKEGGPGAHASPETLRRFVEAMGGQLHILAHFPQGDVVISQFEEIRQQEPADTTT